MAATKYFNYVFGQSGDKSAIPDIAPLDGSVSYQSGWGPFYALQLGVDPDALPIPRPQSNQLAFDMTTAIQQYQQIGIPNFILSSQTDGAGPFPYAKWSWCIYDILDGNGPQPYQSLVNANVTTPPSSSWQLMTYPVSGTLLQDAKYTWVADTGAANAIIALLTPAVLALVPGMRFSVKVIAPNTGATTMVVNALGAVNVSKRTPLGLSALQGGELLTGITYDFLYDGTVIELLNPATSVFMGAKAILTGGSQAIGSGSSSVVNAGTASYDNFGLYDGANKFTAKVAGYYRCGMVTVLSAGTTSGDLAIGFQVNGSTVLEFMSLYLGAPGGSTGAPYGAQDMYLNAGDFVQPFLVNASGATVTVTTIVSTFAYVGSN